MASQQRVRLVIATSAEFCSDAAFVNERAAFAITFEQLDAIPSDSIHPAAVHEQSLGPSPTEASGNHFIGVEHAITVAINKAPHRIAIADQEPPLAVKAQIITASRYLRPRGPVDVKSVGEFELVVKEGSLGERRKHSA
jgi:hypothetical protein